MTPSHPVPVLEGMETPPSSESEMWKRELEDYLRNQLISSQKISSGELLIYQEREEIKTIERLLESLPGQLERFKGRVHDGEGQMKLFREFHHTHFTMKKELSLKFKAGLLDSSGKTKKRTGRKTVIREEEGWD